MPFSFLLEPLNYDFMLRGFAAAIIVGVVCAFIGSFVVLRGMAYFGDALAHAILPGVAIAYLWGGPSGPLFWGAMGAAIFTAFGIGAVTRGGRLREDTAIGVIFAGVFAVGIALISTQRSYTTDLAHILFGNILSISADDLWRIGIFAALVIGTIVLFYKEFVVISFDPTLAATLQLPAEQLRFLLLLLIAVTIVISLQTVGAGLMSAMLITPAATGFLLTKRLSRMIAIAALVGAGSGVVGLYLSYYYTVSSGAAIVLVATLCFALAWGYSHLRRA